MNQTGFLVRLATATCLHTTCLEIPNVGAGRDLAVGVLCRDPYFQVVSFASAKAHVAGTKDDFTVRQAQQLQEMSSATNNQLIWIASISLLVGGVGVMNIMLVTVTERTAEIGLKKAIGAKRRRILAQFLTEASVLTGIGGLLGVLGGIGMSQLISKFMDTPTALSVPAILVAVVFSVLIGLIFGLVPAVKASKLNPIEALRRE